MRSTTSTVRRLIGVLVVSAIPVTGLATPAHAAPPVNITISDATVTEGNTSQVNATFTISMSSPKATATVQWATVAGSATSGTDFVAASGQVSLSKTARNVGVVVKVKPDLLDEPDETFSVVLSNAVGGTITDGTGAGTILDNDSPPSLSANDAAAAEGDGSVDVEISLSVASGRTVTVGYATSDGTALDAEDYTAGSGTITFLPGETTQTATLDLLDDASDEPDEDFTLSLSSPANATIADGSASVAIADDDATPDASAGDVTAGEADGSVTFTVSLSGASASTVTVDYATSDGTAIDAEDYTPASGTLTFAPGETSAAVVVAITNDAIDEPTQTFVLTLSNPVNATATDTDAQASIQDDDGGPWVSVTGAKVSETAGSVTFTLSLDGASQQDVSVDYSTADGSALAGSDYSSVSGTATFLAGETQVQVVVPVLDDSLYELAETFSLNLSNEVGLTIQTGTANASLKSNEKAPTSLTLKVAKSKDTVKAAGRLNYAKIGMKVRVTLLKRANGAWRKVAAKTVAVKSIRDRNGDGIKEGVYRAAFSKPKPGLYRFSVVYGGSSTHRPCQALKKFRI
jgi:hypothetical protein